MNRLEKLCLTFLAAVSLFALTNRKPYLDQRYALRSDVTEYVVKIIVGNSETGTGAMGTGFHVVAPSGKTYILTNRHVCEGAQDNTAMVESGAFSRPARIIYRDPMYDLCILEGIFPGGLKLASKAYRGESVYAVGHPSGYDTTMTLGEIVGYEQIKISDEITTPEDEALCRSRKSSVVRRVRAFGHKTLKLCIDSSVGVITTAQVKPGSSGSPVVDESGNVVGVVYCTESDDNWGRMVPLQQVREFLRER